MAQRTRHDEPGAWLHVMNRGLARRTIFERRADFRYFLACLARAVRAGWFEVHAYSLLGTHFHLLIRSNTGEVWRGLRRAQNAYVRRFNVLRRRDGPLLRGRFCSRRVGSERYWATVVRYIDHNPVSARLVQHPGEWPFGSAHQFLNGRCPPWLARDEIERRAAGGSNHLTPEAYARAFGAPLGDVQRRLVALRLRAPAQPDPFDDLVGAAPSRVAEWMRRKAALGDGTACGLPTLCATELEQRLATTQLRPDADSSPAELRDWEALRAGLLRFCCGITHQEVALRLGCAVSTAQHRLRRYRRLAQTDHPLANLATATVVDALESTWPEPGPDPPRISRTAARDDTGR